MSAPPVAWVVGAGGLLGASVSRALPEPAWRPRQKLVWDQPAPFAASASAALQDFAAEVSATPGRPWAIYWCAGAGVVGTSAAALATEVAAFRLFLERLNGVSTLFTRRGFVLMASSAGGVYAGSTGRPFTDETVPVPISPYGHAKLEQERLLTTWAQARPSVSTLVARITNLYGPGQRLDKPQGLISHMARCLIFGAPVHIYVSLDTIRDYLFSEDAGRRLVAGLGRLAREQRRHVTRVFASEREISIAGLIGVFRRMCRRQLRIVSGLHPSNRLQPALLQFRSTVWPELDGPPTELLEGVGRVYRAQLAAFQQGRLPTPFTPRA